MTFMILGHICTRNCCFCAVATGNPNQTIDWTEGVKIAQLVSDFDLSEVVLTSVTRDDLQDGGAAVFAQVITEIRKVKPEIKIEVLVPDFQGIESSIRTVIDAGCDVFSHNLETTRRLTKLVRDPKADYERSLRVLQYAREYKSDVLIKSGFMVGLGETETEVKQTIDDLVKVSVDILTIGQYLQPSAQAMSVSAYITPLIFNKYKEYALTTGIKNIFSGPFVRSSYARIF